MTSKGSRKFTSAPASVSGPSLLDLLGGQMNVQSGQPHSRASRSRTQEKEKGPTIQGICGPTVFGSSVPDGPLSSWENRLRDRLATIGSTECNLIWRLKTTPAGRSMSRLAASTRPISETGSHGSPKTWPTITSLSFDQSHQPGNSRTFNKTREIMEGAQPLASTWSTPRASDGDKGAPRQQFSGGGQPLPAQMYANNQSVSPWATPKAAAAGPDFAKYDRSKTGPSLQTQMAASASPWVTPSARDWKDTPGMATEGPGGRNRIDQLPRQMAATAPSGPMPNGSTATTAKRGAPNPEFAFWLMGLPLEFHDGALRGMQSVRRSSRK
jgi:hypothetical protein